MNTSSKTLRTQGKMAWKMVVPGSKQNSVEGSAPGECCAPRGEGMVCHVALELLGFFPLCPPVYFFMAPKDRYSND